MAPGTIGQVLGIARIVPVTAVATFIVIPMGMLLLTASYVAVQLAGAQQQVVTFVFRRTEHIFLSLSLIGDDPPTLAALLRVAVGLKRVKILTLRIQDKTHMAEVSFKEQIAGQRHIILAVLLLQIKVHTLRRRPRTSAQNFRRDLRLSCTPGNKHGAPGIVRKAVPCAVLGIVVIPFLIPQLRHGNAQNIQPLNTGVLPGVLKGRHMRNRLLCGNLRYKPSCSRTEYKRCCKHRRQNSEPS